MDAFSDLGLTRTWKADANQKRRKQYPWPAYSQLEVAIVLFFFSFQENDGPQSTTKLLLT